jgi:hypothetical protein
MAGLWKNVMRPTGLSVLLLPWLIAQELSPPPVLTPQQIFGPDHCPVVGDTVTMIGKVSIQSMGGLRLLEFYPQTFPSRIQPICVMYAPHTPGIADRLHIWLVWRDNNGHVDWVHPKWVDPGMYLEVTGKLIGQDRRLDASALDAWELTLEVSDIQNVHVEVNNAISAWQEDCRKWVNAQLSPDVTPVWKDSACRPTREDTCQYRRWVGERPKITYSMNPFDSVNGRATPKCGAYVTFNTPTGEKRSQIFARLPWIVSGNIITAP